MASENISGKRGGGGNAAAMAAASINQWLSKAKSV